MNVKCCRLQFPIGGKPRYCKFSRLTEQDGRCRQRAGRWPGVAGSSAPLSSRATGKASGGAGGRGRFGPTVVAELAGRGPQLLPGPPPGPAGSSQGGGCWAASQHHTANSRSTPALVPAASLHSAATPCSGGQRMAGRGERQEVGGEGATLEPVCPASHGT